MRVGAKLETLTRVIGHSILLSSSLRTCERMVDGESIKRSVKGSIFLGVRMTRRNR